MSEILTINQPEPHIVVATFAGNFDEDSIDDHAPKLTSALEPEGVTALIFDFTNLEYINSRGMGEMAEWYRQIAERTGRILSFGASDRIQDLLEVVGFSDIFEPVKDVDDALKKLAE